MHQWAEGDIVTHGTQLHYYRTGGPKPPLVLAHGITDDGLCWTPVAELLSVQYDVIMVDARGHGKSEAPDQGYNQATMATELSGLITGLGLEHPVILGHSMGAATALTLAGLFPDLPRAILLEDPPTFWNLRQVTPEDDEFRTSFYSWITGHKRKTRSELLAEGRLTNPVWSDAELEPWSDAKHRFSLKITNLLHSKDGTGEDFPALLNKITCPALLITADPQRGAILVEDDVAKLQALVPHLKKVHIPEAGHNIRREQFSRYMSVVEKFLSELTA